MFNRVGAVVLYVQDFETSLKFYRDQVGLPIAVLEPKFAAFKMDNQDFALIDLADGANMVGLDVSAFEAQSGKADRVLLCVDVEDVDAAYETLKSNGVEFTKTPVDQPWGMRAAYFRDPEGNIWELRKFFNPRP
jgi:lactoylglutathione lyase